MFGSIIDEPVRGFVPDESMLSLPGLERVRALMDGRMPASPVQHLTGAAMTQVGHGSSTWVMPASPWFQTQAGFFLNGVVALVADFALGSAIQSVLPAWSFPVTSDINMTYLRPVRTDAGRLIAHARLVDSGRNQATAEAGVEDAAGRVLAHATTRCFVRAADPKDVTYVPPVPVSYDSPDPFERPLPEQPPAPDLGQVPGLDLMTSIAKGELPSPFMALTGQRLGPTIEFGRVEVSYPASPWFTTQAGTIYGGFLCVVADGLTTGAATSILEPGTATASLDLKVHFLRPAFADGATVGGIGEVVHGGRGLIVSRADVMDGRGKPVVSATASFMRRPIRDWTRVEAGPVT